ncbi:DUF3558 domain-containing protein [Streptoalloteichus hindustanus]|uniref:DUF3558 domain-containing protein n=1 Tax=Streptoalloteichus hindustanus TaxID=2017 RepID=A0A1M5KDE9_STRHI|nr:DUF3558 domain-containing protein [Streptoalloteichus hindustanus]SHG50822.1 Protein of unknown function [Streptoalloteichus hindustanus]
MPRKVVKLLAPVFGVLLLGACSGGVTGGDARPVSSSAAGTGNSDAGPLSGVPRVPKALDTARFQKEPCGVLTAAQLQALGVAAQGEPNTTPAPKCAWSDWRGASKMDFSVTIATNRDGLAAVYRNRRNFEHFEPVEIESFPAVLLGGKEVQQGRCDAEVAVTDRLSFSAKVALDDKSKPEDYANPCARAKVVAAEVLKTMKAAS